jgi:anthranilate synthase/aminodeoxychorismate synthase-like glutamine amidotransferase
MSTLKTSEGPDGMGADGRWSTAGGVRITRESRRLPDARTARVRLENALDECRGMLVFRGHDRAVGFVDPPVEIAFAGGRLTVRALNERGAVLLPVLRGALDGVLGEPGEMPGGFGGRVLATQAETFAEEDRTRHAGVFSALRALIAAMAAPDDQLLGLYGAFGYDLIFQFEQIELHQPRRPDDRDLVLQLPDEILEFDLRRDEVVRHRYEFATERAHTTGLPRRTSAEPFVPGPTTEPRDHCPGEYAKVVERAKPLFRSGDLFEVVPGQLFRRGCVQPPSELFRRLWQRNPAPHSLLVNLGEGEYLVGASPEMFVRVRHDHGTDGAGLLVDSSPISGTIARGRDALEDAAQVRALLGSLKEESELTMCTDVDRNDKARVCVPGSVRVTGSVGFDGSLDTVLTLRTIQIRDGVATVRAGATLLHESSPQDEEAETELKAKALLEVLDPPAPVAPVMAVTRSAPGAGVRILLVDHRDSFVHCLADYLRQTGAEVTTYRSGRHLPLLERELPDLLVLSPGPGRPADFQLAATLKEAERLDLPVFGVCLGLQGLVEHYGGQLGVLDEPVHGKASRVRVTDPDCRLFAGLPQTFEVGRYHSLYAEAAALPEELRVTATADDGVVMALEHVSRPLAAVQFHPESIMTAGGRAGQRVVGNAVAALGRRLLPAPR